MPVVSRQVDRAGLAARLGQRSWVLGTIAIANVPLLLLVTASLWLGIREAETRVAEERTALARAAAVTTTAFVEGNLSTIRSLAHAPVFADPARQAELPPVVDRVLADNPDWEGWGLADADGWNVASTGAPPRTLTIGDRPYFKQVVATGRTAVSPAVLNRRTGNATVVLAAPVDFTTGGRGVLIASISTARLGAELAALAGDPSLQFILADSDGRVFLHPVPDVARALPPLAERPEGAVAAALADQTGSRVTRPSGGDELLVAQAPVDGVGWRVLVAQPTATAFDLVRRQTAFALALFALAAASATAIGWFVGGRLALLYRREQRARAEAEASAVQLRAISAESEARRHFLEQLIADAPVAIAVLEGPEHRFVTVNALYRALGPSTEMVGRPFAEVFPRRVSQGLVELLDHVYERGERHVGIDQRRDEETEGGEARERYFTFVFSRYEGVDGEPGGIVVIALETTEAVLARGRAERKKDEFLATASHELKTPLAALSLTAQVLERSLRRDALDPGRLERSVASITAQVDRATRLISELLDISRLEAGRAAPRREPVDLVDLARAAVQRQRDALPDAPRHELVERLELDRLVVRGDDARLDQVLTNLLSNAVKYSRAGGRVEVRVGKENGHATLSVADQGIGVPAAERDRLFSPFRRTSVAHQVGVEGTGLGLYITRRIVEAHEGRIEVADTPGGGATFVVRLPLSREAAEPAEATTGA